MLIMSMSSDDGRFDGEFGKAPAHLWSFTASRDLFFGGIFSTEGGVEGPGLLPADVIAGFLIGNRQTTQWMICGLRFDGVDYRVAYNTWNVEVPGDWGTETDIIDPANDDPLRFRFRHLVDGNYTVQVGNSEQAALDATPIPLVGPPDPLMAGFSVIAFTSPVTYEVYFDSWYSHETEGEQPVNYQVYRDPADGGEYDTEGAHRLLQQVGPAHFDGAVVDQKSVVCDDTTNDTGCDRTPLGV